MTSCSEAFHTLSACAVLIVGVGGSMPAHGIGLACFIVFRDGIEYILQIHNCLLCHGEDGFNLLSVSQLLRDPTISVTFRSNASKLEIQPAENDPKLWGMNGTILEHAAMRSPTKLGHWHSKMLWMSRKMVPGIISEYDTDLISFCDSYFVPPSQPSARRTYRVKDVQDMADLSLRFMGLGTDRLVHTLERSRGLAPASKKKGEKVSIVPPHNFPQGRWKSGKAPKVSKDRVKFLHKASIAEVCFTDTFETDDNQYRYGQAFVD